MPIDDEDDLFNEEFDLVDDDFEDEDDEFEDAEDEFEEVAELDEEDDDGQSDLDAASDSSPQAADDREPTVEKPPAGRKRRGAANGAVTDDAEPVAAEGDEPLDEYGRPMPVANYVVHVYEYQKFKRTIDRPFTPEDAEAFVTEYNRTGKVYGRVAMTGKNDAKPKKSLD